MRIVEFEAPLQAGLIDLKAVKVRTRSAWVAACHPIHYHTKLEPILAGLEGNPFQSLPVLASWFATFAGRGDARECYLATLRDDHGALVFALPLTRRKVAGLMRIELPHSGVIDFTTPFIRPESAARLPAPTNLWDMVLKSLPPADILVFNRMEQGGVAFTNPLFALPQSQASRFTTWRVAPLRARAERHAQLAKAFRKKLRRNREKFLEMPGARFVVARTEAEALPFLRWMEQKQGERIRGKGLDYGLDCPRVKDFYRRLVQGGVEAGQTLIVGMMLGDEIISAGFTILSKSEAVYVRVAIDMERHGALTPGLLVTDASMDEAFARGITQFDFGMGDYHFKRQLGGKANPLRDLIVPLSARGYVPTMLLRLRQWASVHPLVRRVLGRKTLTQPEC